MCGKTVFRGGHRQRFLVGRHAGQPLPAPNRVRQFLTAMLLELRLGIKKIHLRGAAGLEQVDHALGLRSEVRLAKRRSLGPTLTKQTAQCHGTQPIG